jgi:hypothetical protein
MGIWVYKEYKSREREEERGPEEGAGTLYIAFWGVKTP